MTVQEQFPAASNRPGIEFIEFAVVLRGRHAAVASPREGVHHA